MSESLWAYQVDIYERAAGSAYPVVTHIFYGRTQEEANGYYRAHMQTDEFLRGCVQKGRWKRVACRAVADMKQIR